MTNFVGIKAPKAPLTLAIFSCLLVACSSAPKMQPLPTTKAPVVVGTPPLEQQSSATAPATTIITSPSTLPDVIQTTPTQGQFTTQDSAILDAETLAILQDLLEARDMSMVEGDALTIERHGNLWDRIKVGYRLQQPTNNARIEAQKRWFSSNQNYLNRLTARASRYLHHTITEAERRGIPTELALLPVIESSYDPAATSNAQAAGLWQFIPSTGLAYNLKQTSTFDGRRDVIESTRAAYDFLTSLYNQFGSWELALAAYNAGPGRIQRAIENNARAGLPTDYWSLRLPTETMNYVPRFMAVAQIVNNPEMNGVSLPKIANQVHFRAVPVNQGVTLLEVAFITGVSIDELQLLNPALLSGRVEAVAPSRVVIPNEVPAEIDRRLSALQGDGYASSMSTNTGYIAPNSYTAPVTSAGNTLVQTNTLPTTSATLTPHKTVTTEPPLTDEERYYIADMIRRENPYAQPIAADGNINLQALQTGQSVLEARGEKKSLKYNSARPKQSTTRPQAPSHAPAQSYTVKAGDTLTGVAQRHGLTLSQLAQYNNLDPNSRLLRGQKLWLVPNKVSKTSTSTSSKTSTKTTTYKVQSGDTLIGLANRLGVSPSDIAALNAFDDNAQLIAGRNINIPSSAQVTKSQSRPTQTSYTIKAGDSLSSVAAKHGISVSSLASANGLANNAGLVRGKTLVIPSTDSAKNSTQSAKPSVSPSKTDKTESYKVKAGDSLTSLANRFGVSIADLAKANNLATNAKLGIGQTLNVPKLTTTYKVKSGDTLIRLARQFGLSVDELAKMNGLKSDDGLRRGQNLTVPNR